MIRGWFVRLACAVLMLVLPSSLRRLVGVRLLGWDIHPTAVIGRSFILVGHLTMGAKARIGPWNVIRYVDEVRLGPGSSIATRNSIEAHPLAAQVYNHSPNRRAALILGAFAKITNGHEIDCSDLVEFADYGALAGFRSQILTHNFDLIRDWPVTSPVRIGERSMVMSGCILLNGSRVPARSIVAAGSVITTKLTTEQTLYRGNPAQPVRTLPDNVGYFHRREDLDRNIPIDG
jgi:acetyltransferase-like isoleucine patch superfamily enzyme